MLSKTGTGRYSRSASNAYSGKYSAPDFSREQPLLPSPCNDVPVAHLLYSVEPAHPTGLIVATGTPKQQQRGAALILVYGLNRLKLLQDRYRVLRSMEFLGDLIIDLAKSIDALEAPDAALQLEERPQPVLPHGCGC